MGVVPLRPGDVDTPLAGRPVSQLDPALVDGDRLGKVAARVEVGPVGPQLL